MNILRWTAAPFLAARYELELHDALRAEAHRDEAVEVLRCGRHEDAAALTERRLHFRAADELTDVRRANLFLPLGHQYQVHRHLPTRAPNRVQRRQKRRFRPLL